MKNKILIILPTYNEEKNILKLFNRIKLLKINISYLFINDDSTDKTYEIIKEIKEKNKKKIYLIHRKKRNGVGKAHKDALTWAYKKKFNFALTMDTDLTHDPLYIPKILKIKNNYDLIVGSRYLKKNSISNWSFLRVFLSNGAHYMTKLLFKLDVDSTNSFRLYNLNKIKKNFIKKTKSNDYDFFYTSLIYINLNKNTIGQIPMSLKNRHKGVSKMYLSHVIKSIINMFILYFKI